MEAIQILVEGETDCNFLKALLARMPGFLFTLSRPRPRYGKKVTPRRFPFSMRA